jgi:ABC-type antimicrobial peptide transport system permease subunit
MALMIDTGAGHATLEDVRRVVLAKYPTMNMQFFDFRQGILDNLVGDRMMAMLSGFFGVLAALLVVGGLYGVLSYFVSQRRNEIGIRIALGARRWQVIGLVMRDTATMLFFGAIFGTALALLAGRTASSLLFGLKPYDLATLAIACALLAVSAALASWIPALRASRLDPVAALRSE